VGRSSLLAAIDACYALDVSEPQWIEGLVDGCRPFLNYGFGVFGWTFRKGEWMTVLPVGVDPDFGQAMLRTAGCFSEDELLDVFLGRRAASATERLGRGVGLSEHASVGVHLRSLGIQDFHGLTVYDASGQGIALAAAAPRVLRISRHVTHRLERVGAHILAGYRLRRALDAPDAVLDPSGRALHAQGPARDKRHLEALAEAVKTFERVHSARGQRRPDEALEAWEALVAGRWSLVQTFESDGRRYLLARRNPPGAPESTPVSAIEAHALLLRAQGMTHKVMAYELGVSESALHHHVRRGMQKLGISHDTELPSLFRNRAAQELARARA
jgi:DNA-binding CsgD family transcriptional regulator